MKCLKPAGCRTFPILLTATGRNNGFWHFPLNIQLLKQNICVQTNSCYCSTDLFCQSEHQGLCKPEESMVVLIATSLDQSC
jgi:hypothetical protein